MSVSLYKQFMSCEAMALATLNGWKEPGSDALLLGSYVHSWLEGPDAMEKFKQEHPQIFSSRGPTKGELRAEYKYADAMIQAVQNDPFCMFVLQGQKEVIMTADFAGAKWKIKMDAYAPDKGRISDLKTVKSIHEKHWDSNFNCYVSFVEAYGYITQMAVYCEIEKRATRRNEWLEPLIVAVSKEEVPDKEIISFDERRLEIALAVIEETMPRILDLRNGLVDPERCGRCRYCRETKKITRVLHYSELLT